VVGAAVCRRRRCGRRSAVGLGGCADPPARGGGERGGGRGRRAVRRGGAGERGYLHPTGSTRSARRARAPRPPPTARVGTIRGGGGGRVAGWRASADTRRRVGWRRGRRWEVPPRCWSGAPAVCVGRHGGAGAADRRSTHGGRACGGGESNHRPRVTAPAAGGAAGGAERRHRVGKRRAWHLRQRRPVTYGRQAGGERRPPSLVRRRLHPKRSVGGAGGAARRRQWVGWRPHPRWPRATPPPRHPGLRVGGRRHENKKEREPANRGARGDGEAAAGGRQGRPGAA